MRAAGEYYHMCVVGESPEILQSLTTPPQTSTGKELNSAHPGRTEVFHLKIQPISKHKWSPIHVLTEASVAQLVGSGHTPYELRHITGLDL
jgi:hypothetical protein